LNQRGVALEMLGRYEEAKLAFKVADEHAEGRNSVPRINLAGVCDSMGDYACAIEKLTSILETPEYDLRMDQRLALENNLSRAYALSGDYSRASAQLAKTIAAAEKIDGGSQIVALAELTAARNAFKANRLDEAARWASAAERAIYPCCLKGTSCFPRSIAWMALSHSRRVT
jgi:tetratricopeptide (TPR) repeat protein